MDTIGNIAAGYQHEVQSGSNACKRHDDVFIIQCKEETVCSPEHHFLNTLFKSIVRASYYSFIKVISSLRFIISMLLFAYMIPETYEASSILYISVNKIKTILENYICVENNTSVRLQTNCRKTNEI